MATFNGEKYLKPQLESLLCLIGEDDEIVICDDGSEDLTLSILSDYLAHDKRLKLYKNSQNKGVVHNFEYAISLCKNDIIMLCDQDDIWFGGKIDIIKKIFKNSEKSLILHNAEILNSDGEKIKLIKTPYKGVLLNIYKSSYWGCCMAFRKEFVEEILPFPKNLIAHDQWIGLIAEQKKQSLFIDDCLIFHRTHEANQTKKLPLIKKISFRINLIFYILLNHTKRI